RRRIQRGKDRSAEEEALGLRHGTVEACSGVGPVDDVPPGLDVVGLDVLVVEVEGVLPHVELPNRGAAELDVGLLVLQLLDEEISAELVVDEHGPSGALDRRRGGRDVLTELVERTALVVDGCGEFTDRLVSTVRGHVVPEDGVVDVSAAGEGEIAGQLRRSCGVDALTGFGRRFGRRVRALDAGAVVFQKIEWLTCPPRLKARSRVSFGTFARLPLSRASASCSAAVFAPLT